MVLWGGGETEMDAEKKIKVVWDKKLLRIEGMETKVKCI